MIPPGSGTLDSDGPTTSDTFLAVRRVLAVLGAIGMILLAVAGGGTPDRFRCGGMRP